MKKTNKLISILLVAAMLLSMAPITVFAAEIIASGDCGAEGNNATWTLDSDGVLTVDGTGSLGSYTAFDTAPWNDYLESIKKVFVREGVTSIGNGAFRLCENLTEVSLPSTLTSVGQYSFFKCPSLTKIDIPDKVTTIGQSAFFLCTALAQVTLSDSLESIGESAFYGCESLTEIHIPNSVTSLDVYAFFGCTALKKATLSTNLKTIPERAFHECSSLEEITIPDGVTSIGNSAFEDCFSLAKVSLPNSVTTIDDFAFSTCSSLTEITIPDKLTSLSYGAFRSCAKLVKVTIPPSVTSISSTFPFCSGLKEVTIPSSVTSIENNAFENCSALEIVNVPCEWDGTLYTFDSDVKINQHNWVNKDGVCADCKYKCLHTSYTENRCAICGVPHTHSFEYTAGLNGRIVATCVEGGCTLENGDGGTFTIFAPADLYADGTTAKEATVENNLVDTSVAVGDITYSTADGSAPKTAGTYTASVTVEGKTASVQFTLLNYAASVTDGTGKVVKFHTFAEAVEVAQTVTNCTLTLLDDITLTSMLEIASGKFILDLNGKTIITPDGIEIGSAAELTIVDSASDGKISGNMFGIFNDGSLTVNGGIIEASCAVYNYGTVTVDGGNIQGYITNNGALIVNGGTLTRIKNPNTSYTATVEINGGTFTDFNTIENNDGDITVKGGIYPNGFSVTNDGNLEYTANSILADGYYYKDADGKLITVADDATEISGYVKVTKGADLSEAVITLDKTEFTYNGNAIEPTVTVTIGGKTLAEGTDYTLAFENNINAGLASVTIRGNGQAAGGIIGGGENIGNSSNAGEITENCYTGEITKEYTIAPAPIDIIWDGDSFYYTGNPHTVTAKFVDVNGDETPAAITQNETNTEVGNYIATATVDDSNYTVNGATINHAYEIKWYDKSPVPEINGQKGENGWYTGTVYFFGEQGYQVGFKPNSFSHMITMPDSGVTNFLVVYTIEEATGYIAKFELGKFAVDRNDPIAEITMAENKWNSFFNTVTFGKFFKETQSISITAADETSGVAKIEYFIATEEITDFENAEWIEYTEAFTIQPNSKNIIYAKATDNSGRYVIVNSDGIVVYTDSTLDTSIKDEVVYVLTKNAAQSFNLNLNGNTVAYVKIDETVLGEEDYEVLANMILVSAEVLENLSAGEYTITVGINPMGETFAEGDAPAEVTIPLTVKKADVTVDINDFGKVYDGKPATADYKISKSSDSSPAVSNVDYNESVEFKVKGTDDSTYTTDVPVNAGKYTVRITVAETDKISSAVATADFTIAKRPVTVTATAPDKVYDGTTNIDLSKVVITFDGIVDGDDVEYEIWGGGFFNANVGDNKMVGITYEVSGDSVDNYELDSGSLLPIVQPNIVETTASIFAKDIFDAVITLGDALAYNGAEQKQTVESVTVDGLEVTYTVSGNKATNVGVYLLTVTGTGNFTGEAKIAYEIALDDECISHLDRVEDNGIAKWNVKSTDRASLEYVINQLNNAVTDIADVDKKFEWADIKEACEDMRRVINSIELFIADVEEDYAEFDIETVKSSDVPALDELVSKVNEIKDRYGFNLTDEEAQKLEDILDGIEKLKERIAETEEKLKEIKEIENNYNPENITSDDKAAIEEKIAEIEALNPDNLTDEQNAEYEEIKAGFDALLDKISAAIVQVDAVGEVLEALDADRATIFWEDDIESVKAKIDELLADENMGMEEKARLEGYKAQCDNVIEIINTPKEYISCRFFYFIWDCLTWKYNGILWIFSKIFGC